MKKKEIAAALDELGKTVANMKVTAKKGCPITQKQVEALQVGLAVGISYTAMILELPEAMGSPEEDAVATMECATIELAGRKHG